MYINIINMCCGEFHNIILIIHADNIISYNMCVYDYFAHLFAYLRASSPNTPRKHIFLSLQGDEACIIFFFHAPGRAKETKN